MVSRNFNWNAILCITILSAVGCAEQQDRFPVAGKILIDGKPVTKGSIQFVPEEGRPFASKIREDGSFRLAELSVSKDQHPGVSKGKYRIGVSSAEVLDEDSGEVLRQIPAHYADFHTSDLEVEITESQEDLVIELTWEGFEEVEGEKDSEETGQEVESADLTETVSEESTNDTLVQVQEANKE